MQRHKQAIGSSLKTKPTCSAQAASLAKKMGLKVAYAAAPFSAERVQAVLAHLDFLILNEVEAAQLTEATGKTPDALGVRDVVVTLGGDGADWFGPDGKQHFDAHPVTPIDTTGAGDTFTGYLSGGLGSGHAHGAGDWTGDQGGCADGHPQRHRRCDPRSVRSARL